MPPRQAAARPRRAAIRGPWPPGRGRDNRLRETTSDTPVRGEQWIRTAGRPPEGGLAAVGRRAERGTPGGGNWGANEDELGEHRCQRADRAESGTRGDEPQDHPRQEGEEGRGEDCDDRLE